MITTFSFTQEEMEIDEGLGYPKSYAKLCKSPNVLNLYDHGPPFNYMPYVSQEVLRNEELDDIFPIINPDAKPSINPQNYANLLWKQLNHLGNAGFDPAKFRVDPYGNVLYFHADSASPLAWEIDHWFPCSRGGRTVPSNLRLLQWQVCKKKKDKLEFLIPWWDLQLGISANQFLSIFASKSSDFRNRAFSFLFSEGGNEEINAWQNVESHTFPPHFIETEKQVGLVPAAIVLSRKDSSALVLKSLDLNRYSLSNSPVKATRKFLVKDVENDCKAIQPFKLSISKENDNSNTAKNKYHLTISLARDSVMSHQESKKFHSEIRELDNELDELKHRNEMERTSLQELEALLIKRRRRVEKCRRLSESQSSYKSLLEKMIRDAMHKSVIYKEQIRQNQAAINSLMARLEAQGAICQSSKQELQRRFEQRNDIDNKIRPCSEYARRKTRTGDDDSLEEAYAKAIQLFPRNGASQMELRRFIEEEELSTLDGISSNEESEEDTETTISKRSSLGTKEDQSSLMAEKKAKIDNYNHLKLPIREGTCSENKGQKAISLRSAFEEETPSVVDNVHILDHKFHKLAVTEGHHDKISGIKSVRDAYKSLFSKNDSTGNKPINAQNESTKAKSSLAFADQRIFNEKLGKLDIMERNSRTNQEEEVYRRKSGKGNIDKWLQILLENGKGDNDSSNEVKMKKKCTPQRTRLIKLKPLAVADRMPNFDSDSDTKLESFSHKSVEEKITPSLNSRHNFEMKWRGENNGGKREKGIVRSETFSHKSVEEKITPSLNSRNSFEMKRRGENNGGKREKGIVRSESAKLLRPSSPSMIVDMKRRFDCIGKRPPVLG